MISKKNRADTGEVSQIFKNGKFLNSPNLTFKYIKIPGRLHISVVAPKNVAKLAVRRNLLRRRGYAALRKIIDHFPSGVTGVFVFKKPEENISILENEITNILHKIN